MSCLSFSSLGRLNFIHEKAINNSTEHGKNQLSKHLIQAADFEKASPFVAVWENSAKQK